MDDETFLKQFESTTWPKAERHRRQHPKVAWRYLHRYALKTAAVKISENIQVCSQAQGVEEFLARGFHETQEHGRS